MTKIASDRVDLQGKTIKEKQSLYESRKTIFPKLIWGKTQLYRLLVVAFIYLPFFIIPWLSWNGKPLVLFDIPARKFNILHWTIWPQDFPLLALFLIISAFSLFFFTTLAGRLWCGFACPQTMWTMWFMWIEELIEGNERYRKKMAHASSVPMSYRLRKILTRVVWVLIAFFSAFTFVAYFYGAQELAQDLISLSVEPAAIGALAFFTWVTNINAGWLREQVCIYMCPYARFQSVMYDDQTLMVSYNKELGEPRASIKTENAGGCVDCHLCVQVCPTGIDIREGSQIACINCGLCIDACDDVMKSIDRDIKLIGFSSLKKERKLVRKKSIAYSLVLITFFSIFAYKFINRTPLEMNLIRDRNRLTTQSHDGFYQNHFTLKISNKLQDEKTYSIVMTTPGFEIYPDKKWYLQANESQDYELVIQTKDVLETRPLHIEVTDESSGLIVKTLDTKFVFIKP